uniref:Sec-independent protein translocase component TatC n=1 Tax=Helminthora furcellata TaxID=1884666 RepID=A0A1G4NZG2_9FLOR|nr:Sec-independent protein translocase component TatC [Helminthora furcellata]SCW21154.1 Sec-independent protein translocase component TatC [Helminthora furcellata]SCW24014.1 Sec-independent protein translocase component TatC [Helminthora furcellata]
MNKQTYQDNNEKEMSISEHLNELRQRILVTMLLFGISTLSSFLMLKKLTILLQEPAQGVKFLQLAPGEYFFVSVKIAFYVGILLCLPIAIYQIIMFILPGLTGKEANIVVPSLLGSVGLFFLGIIFGYTILAPAALTFFINYGADIIEPIWSFEQYFDFILLLLLSTGLAFQIPVIQVFLGFLNIISSTQMISAWKYVIVIATILGAILTPSTDPFTQMLMATAILALYFSGISVLVIFKK